MKHPQPPQGYRSCLEYTLHAAHCTPGPWQRELRALMALAHQAKMLKREQPVRGSHVDPRQLCRVCRLFKCVDAIESLNLTRRRRR